MFRFVALGLIFMDNVTLAVANNTSAPYVPAMFVFGDSLSDTGNNNFIQNCTLRANMTPYGISAFRHPTGRFSDGLLTFDFIASFLHLSSPPPVLSRPSNVANGLNFASAGCGLLDSTGKHKHVMPLRQQIQMFKNISNTLGQEKASLVTNSLFCITIGGNDIADFFQRTPLNISTEEFPLELIKVYDEHLSALYNSGARKFLLSNMPAVGCVPYARSFTSFCFPAANDMSVMYNSLLRKLVERFNQKDGASVILLDSYTQLMDMIAHGHSYGFVEIKEACCGSGTLNAVTHCGFTTPPDLHCPIPADHLFWDFFHPTQKAAQIFAHTIWTGNSSVMYPSNLSTLVKAN